MANVLIVRAHPFTGDTSRSMKVTDAFVKSYQQEHPQDYVEDINLYDMTLPDIDRDLLSAWGALQKGAPFYSLSDKQQHLVTLFNSFTEGFLAQDKIVVASPLWNLNVPSRLKSWFDTICVAGKTFRYTDEGSVGTVKGKKALHIQANGGVYAGEDPASQYVKTMFQFLGITDFEQLFVEGMDHFPDQAEQIVQEALEKAEELARTF